VQAKESTFSLSESKQVIEYEDDTISSKEYLNPKWEAILDSYSIQPPKVGN
jgi:hypothetical protein